MKFPALLLSFFLMGRLQRSMGTLTSWARTEFSTVRNDCASFDAGARDAYDRTSDQTELDSFSEFPTRAQGSNSI